MHKCKSVNKHCRYSLFVTVNVAAMSASHVKFLHFIAIIEYLGGGSGVFFCVLFFVHADFTTQSAVSIMRQAQIA